MKHFLIKWVNKKGNKESRILTSNDIAEVLYKFDKEYDSANQITSIELVGITINEIYYHF